MPTNPLYCPIRKEWVAALPEEQIRQYWLQRMIHELDYPAGGFVLEKSLHQMPHLALSQIKLPSRRADLVFFAKGIHPSYDLYPLLLIECKALKLNAKVVHQVVGYNYYLRAPFVAIANGEEIRLGWYNTQQQQYCFIPHLDSYHNLIKRLQSIN